MSAFASRTFTAAAGPTFNSTGLVEWGIKNLIPLLLLVIGLGIIASARKGRMSDNANTLTNVMLGCGVIAGGALLFAFSSQVAHLMFNG